MENENTKETEINISEIFFLLLNKLWIIIAVALIFALVTFSYIQLFVTPMYTASASFFVDIDITDSSSASSGLSITSSISKEYPTIIKSRRVLGQVIDNLGLGNITTYNALSSNVRITFPQNSSRVMIVSASFMYPELAADIANEIVAVSSEVLPHYSEFANIVISPIDSAEAPASPSSPSTFRNTIIAAFIGAVLAALVIVIIYMFDDKMKKVEDVEKYLDLSVLGVIPFIETKREKKYQSEKYRSDRYQNNNTAAR